MNYQQIVDATKRLMDMKPSHTDTQRIKGGPQLDMYEKEITNHEGFGPVVKVIGKTKDEAEALAAVLCGIVSGHFAALPHTDYSHLK